MTGSLSQKIARAVANLLLHPQYISRCLAHNLLFGVPLLDLELPWFSYGSIDFLDQFVKPHMKVFEYGSGGSTLFFARRAKSVFAVEDDPKWFHYVSRHLDQRHLPNVTLKLRPFDVYHTKHFAQSEYFLAMPEESFDVIVVDGSEDNGSPVRPICFQKAEEHINPQGIIVLDDSWRYPELRKTNYSNFCRTFETVGPGRPGVTSTDIFFY